VIGWVDGGRTDLDNLTLVCGFHHREHRKRGWTCHMTNGVPYWRPPSWLDHTPPKHHPPHSPELHRVPNTSADLTLPLAGRKQHGRAGITAGSARRWSALTRGRVRSGLLLRAVESAFVGMSARGFASPTTGRWFSAMKFTAD
jgi:hypothetical protein